LGSSGLGGSAVPATALAQEADARDESRVEYARSTAGTRWLESERGTTIKLLVEAANLGGSEVEIGEITFPGGPRPAGQGHLHGSIEIFYVLSGEMNHVVNGESHLLKPGMVGIVRPGDRVAHGVNSTDPVRALVVWAPGGEADRIRGGTGPI
jgi:quercetin dioxygenase-like cupin family protein